MEKEEGQSKILTPNDYSKVLSEYAEAHSRGNFDSERVARARPFREQLKAHDAALRAENENLQERRDGLVETLDGVKQELYSANKGRDEARKRIEKLERSRDLNRRCLVETQRALEEADADLAAANGWLEKITGPFDTEAEGWPEYYRDVARLSHCTDVIDAIDGCIAYLTREQGEGNKQLNVLVPMANSNEAEWQSQSASIGSERAVPDGQPKQPVDEWKDWLRTLRETDIPPKHRNRAYNLLARYIRKLETYQPPEERLREVLPLWMRELSDIGEVVPLDREKLIADITALFGAE